MSVQERLKLDHGLLAALEHFSRSWAMPDSRVFFYTDDKGNRELYSDFRACEQALDILSSEELYRLKFRALVTGLVDIGMEDIYERIMREKVRDEDVVPRRRR